MNPIVPRLLAAHGLKLDEEGSLVPLFRPLSPSEAFALEAARMTEARTRRDGPSPKSARRRARQAARAKAATGS